jgi:hypothetical protein
MSSSGATTALSFAFGDLGSAVWGLAWNARGGEASLVLGKDEAVRVSPAQVQAPSPEGDWAVTTEGTELSLEPAGEPVAPGREREDSSSLDQLCRAHGRLVLEAEEVVVDCLGWRQVRGARTAVDWGAIRQAAAWFGVEEAIALTALRPRGATEHDRDVVEAVVLGSDQAGPVEDPRLSTTYARDGSPKAAGLELWLPRPDTDELYPLRASGEAVGAEATWSQTGTELEARLFEWHSRGREGAGVYLLGRRR